MLCNPPPRPVNGSRWPIAGSEPSNSDKHLQNTEPRPDSYFSWFALFKWFLEWLPPTFPTLKCLQHLAERGHTYHSLKITFLLIPVQRYLLLFNLTPQTKLLRLRVGCSRILEMALIL